MTMPMDPDLEGNYKVSFTKTKVVPEPFSFYSRSTFAKIMRNGAPDGEHTVVAIFVHQGN